MSADSLFADGNVIRPQQGYPSGASPECAHDWRVNPVVVVTTTTRYDREQWVCTKCGAWTSGPEMRTASSAKVSPFDPTTWEKRP